MLYFLLLEVKKITSFYLNMLLILSTPSWLRFYNASLVIHFLIKLVSLFELQNYFHLECSWDFCKNEKNVLYSRLDKTKEKNNNNKKKKLKVKKNEKKFFTQKVKKKKLMEIFCNISLVKKRTKLLLNFLINSRYLGKTFKIASRRLFLFMSLVVELRGNNAITSTLNKKMLI